MCLQEAFLNSRLLNVGQMIFINELSAGAPNKRVASFLFFNRDYILLTHMTFATLALQDQDWRHTVGQYFPVQKEKSSEKAESDRAHACKRTG